MLFGWIWGADVAGVFAALGVDLDRRRAGAAERGRIGLSGLFLIFEPPFEIGDSIVTGGGQGPDHRGELARDAPRHRQRHRGDARPPSWREGRSRTCRAAPDRRTRRTRQFCASRPTTRRSGCGSCWSRSRGTSRSSSPDREPSATTLDRAEVRDRRSRCSRPGRQGRRRSSVPHAALVRGAAGRTAPRRRPDRRLAHTRPAAGRAARRSRRSSACMPGDAEALAAARAARALLRGRGDPATGHGADATRFILTGHGGARHPDRGGLRPGDRARAATMRSGSPPSPARRRSRVRSR